MDKRNYGIDFLRMISMFMIVILHILGIGGILNSAQPYSINYYTAWFLEIFSYCAINCFAMISGFVMCNSKPKLSKITELWFQIIFYTISIFLFFLIISPADINIKAIAKTLFPISTQHYWYLSAYFGLYLLIPFLNIAIKHLNQKVYTVSLIAIFVVFNILPTLTLTDTYALKGGYSTLWLCLLYLLGAYIKKYDVLNKTKKIWGWILFLASVSITFLSKLLLDFITPLIFGEVKCDQLLISYNSPTMVLAGIGLFLAFANMKFNNKLEKAVAVLSPAVLGVYIIHANTFIWESVLKDFAATFSDYNTFIMVSLVIAFAIIIYTVCSATDILRIKLFKILKINNLCNKLEIFVYKKINKLFYKK